MERDGLPPAGAQPFAFLEDHLASLGLCLRGGFALIPEDQLGTGSLVLVGSVGPALWPVATAGFRGELDPLDDWTRRVMDPLAEQSGARVLYPFSGPPFHPFQGWLQRALGLHRSPTGLLIDPVFGLWHAVRAALILPLAWPFPPAERKLSPCESCETKPCLTACPTQAITAVGPEPDRCAAELVGSDRGQCLQGGCLARNACPVGQLHRYSPDQQAFHQQAFLRLIS